MVIFDVWLVLEVFGDCCVEYCIIDVNFLMDVGFVVVVLYLYFLRLCFELDKGLGWKVEVEVVFECLLENV